MIFRHLSFVIILVSRGFILNNQCDFSSMVRQVVLRNELTSSKKADFLKNRNDMISLKTNLRNSVQNKDTILKGKKAVAEKSMQDYSKEMVIQVGAFLHESNALALKNRLSVLLNNTVTIIPAGGFFKVHITGFKNSEEIENLIPALGLLGMKNIWIFHDRKKEDIKSIYIVQTDSSLNAVRENMNLLIASKENPATKEPTINLQVGVFHSRQEALRAQRRITSKLNLPVEIVKQWEFYIVFITGFKTREEIFKYYPKLAALGYPDSFMIENIKTQ